MAMACRRRRPSWLALALAAANLRSNSHFLHASAFTPSLAAHRSGCPLFLNTAQQVHGYLPEASAGPIPDECRFTEDQIHSLIHKRQLFKRQKQYKEADEVLAGLNQYGIYVHDKRKEWRGDGQNHFGRQVHYVQRGGSYGLSEEDAISVSKMVEDRSLAKRKKQYHLSDDLANILKAKYNVKVNDKNREWSVVVSNWDEESPLNNNALQYVPSPIATSDDPTHTMSDESKTRIAQRLADRVAFRKKKDYRTADKILEELMEEFSIIIDDRTREWKVVLGNNADDDAFARDAQLSQRSAFVRRENTSKHDETERQVIAGGMTASIVKNGIGGKVEVGQDELNSLTVVKLKEQLRQAGLPVSGKKADLIERLMNNGSNNL